MELGQRLKQARLEAGLSQRQLCEDLITRNMLSQIENGSAKPSMETLRYLATQLGKPISFFLEEAASSPNQTKLQTAREAWSQGDPAAAIAGNRLQMANGAVYDYQRNIIPVHNAKLDALTEIVDTNPGENLLVFYNYQGVQRPQGRGGLERRKGGDAPVPPGQLRPRTEPAAGRPHHRVVRADMESGAVSAGQRPTAQTRTDPERHHPPHRLLRHAG